MKHRTLIFTKWASCLLLGILMTGCPGKSKLTTEDLLKENAAISYARADLTTNPPTIIQPTGSSAIKELVLTTKGDLDYSKADEGHSMGATDQKPMIFDVDLKQPSLLQVAINVSFNGVDASKEYFKLTVNGTDVPFHVLEGYYYNTHLVAADVPESLTNAKGNTIEIKETYSGAGAIFAKGITVMAQKVIADGENLTTTLYTQFGNKYQNKADTSIWTRSYGLSSTVEMLPGPTLFYKPGDLVSVKIVNQLNPETSLALKDFQDRQAASLQSDEVLAGDEVRGEINIPHNLNNTNLHVHGLHVDPAKDDVTIVIVPEGADTTGYDAPHTHAPVRTLDSLNEFSVSDQGIKAGKWVYQYRIPEIHLPGTHWFHPHKHGSTSAQVENGLAGTMVIMESPDNAVVPFPNQPNGNSTQTSYDRDAWNGRHDRVLAIQEITNFGLQAGQGNNQGLRRIDTVAQSSNPNPAGDIIDLTVNGIDSLVLDIRPGQLERWRVVNAGTNHRSFSHVFLARRTNDTLKVSMKNNNTGAVSQVPTVVYESADMHLVAVDGIPLPKKYKVTAAKPALLAPGNRNDYLVQLSTVGEYVLFKNYKPNQAISIKVDGEIKYSYAPNYTTTAAVDFPPARLEAQGKNDAYIFEDTGIQPDNYTGFSFRWVQPNDTAKTKSVAPIIRVNQVSGTDFIDVDFATKSDFGKGATGWTPINVNDAGLTDGELMWVNVSGTPVDPETTPSMPSDDYLKTIAPVTSGKAPKYVSPVTNKDVLQSRPVIFDVSGTAVNVFEPDDQGRKNPQTVNQFTLNGRYFVLNDPIGNPNANEIIKRGLTSPDEIESKDDQQNIQQPLQFTTAGPIQWKTNKVGDQWYFSNPGYFQEVTTRRGIYQPAKVNGVKPPAVRSEVYDFDANGQIPDWKKYSGIENPSVVNKDAYEYDKNKTDASGLPIAQTGEEWILINNSDVSHPFHIHINPFFVVEVGQLSYEKYKTADDKEETDWFMRAVTAPGDEWPQRPSFDSGTPTPGKVYKGKIGVDAIVGNWWDTLVIPAHGYVKVRYWFNVPNQEGNGTVAKVLDDFNKTGIWVYHCHILRHEDRGMMMPVITRKNGGK